MTTNKIKLAIGLPVYTGYITAFAQRMWLSIGALPAQTPRTRGVKSARKKGRR